LRRQRFPLDRWIPFLYIGAGALLAGCPGRLPPLVPEPLAPAERDSALAWTAATLPARHTLIRFRWKYRDRDKTYAGRATVRIAPPDSLRLDYAGPFNWGAGAAVVIGDSTVWADPEKNFRSLVPAVRMLWAGLGIARPPAPGAVVLGARAEGPDSSVRIWRFVQDEDTLDYRVAMGRARLFEAEWRRQGKVMARSRAELDGRAKPASARIDFPEGPARFELTVGAVDTIAVFDSATWRRRR
jgi:hypothetical protein